MIKLDLKAVYQYRNRWSYGLISGHLDLKDRRFYPQRKKGYRSIKDRFDINGIDDIKNYVTLQKFLAERVVRRDSQHESYKEAKFVERLILNSSGIKRMWVNMESAISR